MSSVFDLTKKVVTYSQDKTKWSWKEFKLGTICKSPAYAKTKVTLNNQTVDLLTAVASYQHAQDKKDWASARVFKDVIWSALDNASRNRIKTFYELPEARIATVFMPNNESNENIVAFYALIEENYYHGELESIVPGDYKEFINTKITWDDPAGKFERKVIRNDKVQSVKYKTAKVYGVYTEEHIIGGNSDVRFEDFMHVSPQYTWLPKAIAIAKQFSIEPNWRPCVLSGRRGIGLTAHDARELQVVTNWYSGLSDIDKEDIKCDWSDMIWLHHKNGIDSIQISEREYRSNPDKWQDWKETEDRDFLTGLYKSEEPTDETEEIDYTTDKYNI